MSYALSLSQKIGNTQRLEPFPSLDFGFSTSGYVNDGGFANQQSVGSSNFLIPSYSGPNPVFSRATAATFRGSNGLIQYAPENLLPNSESFDNLTWTKGNLNTTGTPSWINVETAPNGLNVADCIFANSTASGHYIRYTGLSGIQSNAVTFSVFLKKNGYDRAIISVLSVTSPFEQFRIDVNLLTGSYSSAASGGGVFITASVIDVGNSWFRCSVTGSIGTKTEPTPNVSILESSGASSFSGDPTKGIYIWGAQLERSSTARPYISTTTTERYGPRFEYDANGNPLGLLMEESSENLVWYGNSLETTGSKWQGLASGAASSITLNNTTSPTGIVNSASLLTFNTAVTGAGSYSIWRQNYATTTSGTYTFSVWLRSGSNSSVYIRINDSTGNKGKLLCNLTTSWQRFVITSTTSGTITGVSVDIGADGNAGETMTAGNIYVWGAQLEAKPFVTSYIPTAASGGIVRAADTCTLNIDLGNSWFNESEGTIMVEGDRLHSPALNVPSLDSLFAFSSGGSPSITHYCDGASEFFSLADGSYIVTALSVSLPNQPLLFVGSYSASSSEIYVSTNNTATQSEAGFSPFSTPDTITLGYSDTINIYLNGHIKSFKYYKKSLDSTIMEALPL